MLQGFKQSAVGMNRRHFASFAVAALAFRASAAEVASSVREPQITSNSPGQVQVSRQGAVMSIALDRPQCGNLLDAPMLLGLSAAYKELEDDPELRVAVLHGKGQDFCLGVDVPSVAAAQSAGVLPTREDPNFINPMGLRARLRTKPVVVAVHGRVLFGGHELFLSADIRVADMNAIFGQAEVTRGIFAAGGATIRFTREAGWANAMRYMLTGEQWNAEEAYRMGLVQEVTLPEQHLKRAKELALMIARASPLGVAATLRTARVSLAGEAQAFSQLPEEFSKIIKSEDRAEAARAFREGRAPQFPGK